jgi:hypothetical protein
MSQSLIATSFLVFRIGNSLLLERFYLAFGICDVNFFFVFLLHLFFFSCAFITNANSSSSLRSVTPPQSRTKSHFTPLAFGALLLPLLIR